MRRTHAAVLLVGNELLSGKVRDSNSHFLAGELFAMGVALRRTVVVPDEILEIVEALTDLRGRADVVFTSGGIGPTHDDITVAAVAEALGRPLVEHPGLVERARAIFGPKLGPEHLRMAAVPEGCALVESEHVRWPVIVVDCVFVLAGVPGIFRRGFETVRHLVPGQATAARVAVLTLAADEWSITPALNRTVAAFPGVLIGSYPVQTEEGWRVSVTFEAVDRPLVAAAADHLAAALPDGALLARKD